MYYWRGLSLKGRLPQKLQSKSTLSCKIVQIYSLFCHGFIKQEGHDGPVSLHWLILGNLFKTLDPEEELKLVAMSSNKKNSKYFTK